MDIDYLPDNYYGLQIYWIKNIKNTDDIMFLSSI